jgi:hypothetical protein
MNPNNYLVRVSFLDFFPFSVGFSRNFYRSSFVSESGIGFSSTCFVFSTENRMSIRVRDGFSTDFGYI